MAAGSGGAPAGAGTTDVRVDRPEEGLPGLATVANPSANPVSRATFDAGVAAGAESAGQVAQIDTSGTSFNTPSADVKRGKPGAW
jgi:hypothetical protein